MLAYLTRTLVIAIVALVSLTAAPASATPLALTLDGTNAEAPTVIQSMEFKLLKSNARNTFRVAMSNPSNNTITLRVKEGSRTIFSTTFRNQSTVRETLSLSKLPAGVYTLEVTDGMTSYNQSITVVQ